MESICIIKPHAMDDMGNILQEFINKCINITDIKLIDNDKVWSKILSEDSKMMKGKLLVFIVSGDDIFNLLDEFIGNDRVILADEHTIRYMYGDLYGDKFNNVIYYNKNSKDFNKCYKLLFGE